MTMREKMARAIMAKDQSLEELPPIAWEGAHELMRETCLSYADAALEALMEPTEGMVQAAARCKEHPFGGTEAWPLMIRGAKAGK